MEPWYTAKKISIVQCYAPIPTKEHIQGKMICANFLILRLSSNYMRPQEGCVFGMAALAASPLQRC